MPIYMNFDGITGNVTAEGHEKWIELNSCQLGVHRSVTNTTGSAVGGGDTGAAVAAPTRPPARGVPFWDSPTSRTPPSVGRADRSAPHAANGGSR